MDARFDLILFSGCLDKTFDIVLLLNVIVISNMLVILALLHTSRTLTHPHMLQKQQQLHLLETVDHSVAGCTVYREDTEVGAHRIRQCMENLNSRARNLVEKEELGGEELEHLLTLYIFILDCIDSGRPKDSKR